MNHNLYKSVIFLMCIFLVFQAKAEEQDLKCARPYPMWVISEEFKEKFKQGFPNEMYDLKWGEQVNWLTVKYRISNSGKPVQLQFLSVSEKCNPKCVDIAEKIILKYAKQAPSPINPKTYKRTDLNKIPVSDTCYLMEFVYTEPPSLWDAWNGISDLVKGK